MDVIRSIHPLTHAHKPNQTKPNKTGRCKFPLLNGKVLEDQSIDSEGDDKEVIAWCVSSDEKAFVKVDGSGADYVCGKGKAVHASRRSRSRRALMNAGPGKGKTTDAFHTDVNSTVLVPILPRLSVTFPPHTAPSAPSRTPWRTAASRAHRPVRCRLLLLPLCFVCSQRVPPAAAVCADRSIPLPMCSHQCMHAYPKA